MRKKLRMSVVAVIVIIAVELSLLGSLAIRRLFSGRYASPAPRELTTLGDGDPMSMLVMGDSTFAAEGILYEQGMISLLQQRLSEEYSVTLLNTARSDDTSKDLLNEQLDFVTKQGFEPDIVVIFIGANDVFLMRSLSDSVDYIAATVDTLTSRSPGVHIYLFHVHDVGKLPGLPYVYRFFMGLRKASMNTLLDELGLRYESVSIVDWAKVEQLIDGSRRQYFQIFDGLHLNELGHEEAARYLYKELFDATTLHF